MSIDEMIAREEIKVACESKSFPRETLLSWILPNLTVLEELPFFARCNLWTIEESIFIWLNLNPFIAIDALKIIRPEFITTNLQPNYREQYYQYLAIAHRAAIDHALMTVIDGGKRYVTPRDFYEWAMKKLGEPQSDVISRFFGKLLAIPDIAETDKALQEIAIDHADERQNCVAETNLQAVVNVEHPQSAGQEIHYLFDPLGQTAIATLFYKVTSAEWQKHFERAARNGLCEARQGENIPSQYNPAKVADWLITKGHYSREQADRTLARNLPHRSRDYKYMLTGDYD